MNSVKIKFNKQEFSGAFGDIGTDFPLIVAIILATKIDAPSVLIMFGIMQILTGLIYKMPMPAQPLKAMAAIVITQKVGEGILIGAGLAIGVTMFIFSITGILDKLNQIVPKEVIRGIQLGLGISLALLSFKQYISADSIAGYILAFIAFVIILLFIDNKKYPASIIVIALGFLYTFIYKENLLSVLSSFSISIPVFFVPSIDDILSGFVLLTLPQIPLSLGNSIMATKQISNDLFPERNDVTIKKIGFTYSIMNLISPFFSGIPCCHGAGGLVGHYSFGGRTGGSVIIYGSMYVILGLLFGNNFQQIANIFPLPVLGVILLFEGIALMSLIKDQLGDKKRFLIALIVGIIAAGLPYGFIISMIIGTIISYSPIKIQAFTKLGEQKSV